MSTPKVLSRIPVLRILLPFVVGILIHRLWHVLWAPFLLVLAAIGIYLFLVAKSRTPHERLKMRPYFTLPIVMAALALGWLCSVIHCPPRLTDAQRANHDISGRVIDLDYTNYSMRMTIDVIDSTMPRCMVLLSTRGCDYTVRAGDLVEWTASLEEIGNMGNPGEMDYASYMLNNKGIRYQQHLPLGQVKRIGYSLTLLTKLANTRRDMRQMVFNSRLSPPAARFVTALLLGDSHSIDKATRQEFSAAGVAHVLALSGLHVGLISLIIWWLLFPLDHIRLRKLRMVITLAAIAMFAVFTGLSPSVIRATVMIGVTFASLIFHRRTISLNALTLAALAILVFSPSSIYSVGFQLSFITVGAILLLAQRPVPFCNGNKLVNSIVSIVLTSLVALLATVALTAHYFHTISLMSVLANLLILPVLPVFMVLAALFLLVTAAGMEWQLLNKAIDAVYGYIHWSTGAVNALPFSHIGGVYVSVFGVVAYFIAMAFLLLWLYRRHYRYLIWSGCAIVVLLAHSLWVDHNTPRKGLVIFNSYMTTPILYYENDTAFIWIPEGEQPDSTTFSRYHAGFLARYRIGELRFVEEGDTLRLKNALIMPPLAHLMGERILAVGSGKWKRATTDHRLTLDDIIITKRFHGTAAKLQELYRFKRLILSGALQKKTLLQHECDSLSIEVHDLSTQGALEISAR